MKQEPIINKQNVQSNKQPKATNEVNNVLESDYIDKIISMYTTNRIGGVVEELVYVYILTTSMYIQYYNLFKFYFQDYSFKMIIYSFFIFTTNLLNKIRTNTEARDPLNGCKVQDFLNVLSNIQWMAPLILVWTLYESFTIMKIVLLLYYFVFKTILFVFVEEKSRYISVKMNIYKCLSNIMMKLIESLYFVFFLPLSTYNNTKLKGIFFMT